MWACRQSAIQRCAPLDTTPIDAINLKIAQEGAKVNETRWSGRMTHSTATPASASTRAQGMETSPAAAMPSRRAAAWRAPSTCATATRGARSSCWSGGTGRTRPTGGRKAGWALTDGRSRRRERSGELCCGEATGWCSSRRTDPVRSSTYCKLACGPSQVVSAAPARCSAKRCGCRGQSGPDGCRARCARTTSWSLDWGGR
mmetsp:Transcript_26569/g.65734  ORF Transcript_26569/g.65734 Transcript_26569/m.65734 type:complete len:201 (-) Transcript_26569:253-855(-)